MNISNKGRFLFCLSLALMFGLVTVSSVDAALFGLFKSKKSASAVSKKTLVVFPFDENSSIQADGFGEELASALRNLLAEKSPYTVFLYKDKLSPIKRATDDNTIKSKEEIAPPFAEDPAKAMSLAKILASDYFLVGSIEDYQFDSDKNTAQLTLRADLFMSEGKSDKPIKTLIITGVTPASTKATEDDELRAIAAGDAIAKLHAELAAEAKPEAKPEESAPAENVPAETVPDAPVPAPAN